MGLQVVTADDTPPTFARSLLRNALKFAPWELAHTIIWYMVNNAEPVALLAIVGNLVVYGLMIYYLVTLVRSSDHQTAYDQWAGLYVKPRPVP